MTAEQLKIIKIISLYLDKRNRVRKKMGLDIISEKSHGFQQR